MQLFEYIDTQKEVTFEFERKMHSTRENIGSVQVCAVNRSIVPHTSTSVLQVSTANGSAIGKFLTANVL